MLKIEGVMIMAITKEAEQIMNERFGKDSIISIATCRENIPEVRCVDAYYEDGAFYVLTYALSSKMVQITSNPNVAIAGEWFTAHGKGKNLGYFGKDENKHIAETMKRYFAAWIDNGHNNFEDENTIILKIELTDGVLFANGCRYDIEF